MAHNRIAQAVQEALRNPDELTVTIRFANGEKDELAAAGVAFFGRMTDCFSSTKDGNGLVARDNTPPSRFDIAKALRNIANAIECE